MNQTKLDQTLSTDVDSDDMESSRLVINNELLPLNKDDNNQNANSVATNKSIGNRSKSLGETAALLTKLEKLERRIDDIEAHKSDQSTLVWRKELESSGLHGLASLVNSRSQVQRIMWIILLVTFFCLAVLHTCATISNAMQSQTHFKISYKRTRELPFSYFTLCSHHGMFLNISRLIHNEFLMRSRPNKNLTNSNSQEYPDLASLSEYDFTLSDWVAILAAVPDIGYMTDLSLSNTNFTKKSFDLIPALSRISSLFHEDVAAAFAYVVTKYSIPCSSVFRRCFYDAVQFNCCDLFEPIFNVFYGRCYYTKMELLIDANFNLTAKKKDHFLWIEIDNWSDPHPPAASLEMAVSGLAGAISLQLGIEQWYNILHAIMPYTRNEFSFDFRYVKDLKTGDCVESKDIHARLLRDYSSERCSAETGLINFDRESDCNWPIFQLLNPTYVKNEKVATGRGHPSNRANFSEKSQSFHKRHNCFRLDGAKIFNENLQFSKLNADSNLCGEPCERREYALSNRQEVKGYNGRNIVLHMYFGNPSYTILEEVKTLNWTDYLSMVGGLWGLWLGSSVITFIHIGATAIYVLVQKLRRRCEKKRR